MNSVTGLALYLHGNQPSLISHLQLGGVGRNGVGIYADQNVGSGLIIEDVTASNRNVGIDLQGGGQNLTVTGNTLTNDNTAMYLDSFTAASPFTVPVIASGNIVTGSGNGFQLFNLGTSANPQFIGTSGTGIIINNAADGFRTTNGYALWIRNLPGATISGVNLSGTSGSNGVGIYADSSLGNGVTIQNVTASNRNYGIYAVSADLNLTVTGNTLSNDNTGLQLQNGQNLTVTGNTLTADGTAMYLDTFTAAAPFTVPVIASGNIVTGSSNGFQLWNLGTSGNPQFIGTSGNGIIVNNAADGFQTVTNIPLYVRNLPGATISGLDLSGTGNRNGIGIYSDTNLGQGVTIENVNASNRNTGIQLQAGGQDLTLTGNDLANDNTGLYLDSFSRSSFTTPVIGSGNNVAGDSTGFQLFNMSGLFIGTSGTGIIVDNAADGFQTVTNIPLYIRNLTGSTISGLDLSSSVGTRNGYGIYSDSNVGQGVTIENVNASNHNTGIQLQAGGYDLTLTGNDLSNDNTGLYLDSFSQSSFTTPVIASGNTVTGDSTGFQLFNMSGLFIGTSGTGIIVNNAADGFQTVANIPLYIHNLTGSTISGLDLSYSGNGRNGMGIFSDANVGQGVTIENVNASNRNAGIQLQAGGYDLTLTGNDLANDNTGLYLDSFGHSSFTTPVIASGNNVADDSTGFQLFNMSGLFIGTSGTGIIVNNAADGFQTTTGMALYIRNLPNSTISGLDLSYSGLSREGTGIYSDSYLGSGVTIQNVNTANRSNGLLLQGGGANLTLNNNGLTNDGTSLYVNAFSGNSPITGSGNNFAGSTNALNLLNINGLVIGNSVAQGVNFIIDDNSGLDSVTGTAIELNSCSNITIDGVDVSYRDLTRSGIGINATDGNNDNLTVTNVTAENRQTGLVYNPNTGNSGYLVTVTNSSFLNNDTGLVVVQYNSGGAVTNNVIEANGTGITYYTGGGSQSITLDAEDNYWGPGGGPGQGGNNDVNGPVDTSNFVASVPTALSRDYGTAPSAFGFSTELGSFGGRSIVSGPYFGTTPPTATADGSPTTLVNTPDLATNGIGISALVPGQTATATIFVSGAPSGAMLDAWVDFQQDGTWTDPGDQIAASVALVNGLNTVTFSVPANATISLNYARFRISTAGGQTPYGQSDDGEVLDLAIAGSIYVDKDWSGLTTGTYITDADPVMPGNQAAVFGINAFASINAGIAAASAGGVVIVNAGTTGNPGDYSGEAVNINQSGLTVVLQQGDITVGSLADTVSNDTVELNGVSLTEGGNDNSTQFAGTIAGTGGLTKTGSGTLALTGTAAYSGATAVVAGTLEVDGSVAASSSVTVDNGGTLDGTGTVNGSVTVQSSGTFAPGDDIGVLNVGSLALDSGAVFNAVLNGTSKAQFNQAIVGGSVNLNADSGTAANLNLSLGYAPTVGDQFTIIANNGGSAVSGTFAGLAQGAIISASFGGTSYPFSLDYAGGAGNDLVLTAITLAPTTTTISAPTVTYGSNGVVTITVNSSGATPAGNVTLSVDGGTPITQALTNGSSVFTLSGLHAGSHSLSANYETQGYFAASSSNGTLTVSPFAFSYMIGNDGQTYGSTANLAADLPATISTGVNGETLDITYGSTGDTTTAHVGSDAVTGALSSGTGQVSDYSVTLTNGTLTVSPFAFSYMIGNDSQTYGSPANLAGDLPATINTGVNGETLDITYGSTGDTTTAHVGSDAVTGALSSGTGQLSDYSVTLTNGTLTVSPFAFSYMIGNDSQTYGSPANLAGDLPATINTGVNGETLDITYGSNGDTTTAHVGSDAVTGTLSSGTGQLSDYSVTLTNGTLTVNPFAFSYLIGNDSQTYGSPANLTADLPATINTGVNGETLDINYGSTGDTATAHVGSCAITGALSSGTGQLSDYSVTLTNGTLTVNPFAFSYTIGNDSQTYGNSANLTADLPAMISTGVNGETLDIAYSSTGDTTTAHVGSFAVTGAAVEWNGPTLGLFGYPHQRRAGRQSVRVQLPHRQRRSDLRQHGQPRGRSSRDDQHRHQRRDARHYLRQHRRLHNGTGRQLCHLRRAVEWDGPALGLCGRADQWHAERQPVHVQLHHRQRQSDLRQHGQPGGRSAGDDQHRDQRRDARPYLQQHRRHHDDAHRQLCHHRHAVEWHGPTLGLFSDADQRRADRQPVRVHLPHRQRQPDLRQSGQPG